MARWVWRGGFALVGALLALGPLPATGWAVPAPAAPTAGACGDTSGITVVVDFTAFDGGIQVRCAPQPVDSGFDALRRAGFVPQGTTQFPGLLCRINGLPEPEVDPCHGAPPANAYWAYWHAPRGGDWTYSSSGAGSRVPPKGSVEGWAFGNDVEPGIDPPAPLVTTTTTRPAATTTTRPPSGGGGGTPVPGATDGPDPAATGGTDTDTDTPSPSSPGDTSTTTARDAGASTDGAEDGADDDDVAGAPPSAGGSSPSGGSPTGAIVGLVTAAGLSTAGVITARRRRAATGETA